MSLPARARLSLLACALGLALPGLAGAQQAQRPEVAAAAAKLKLSEATLARKMKKWGLHAGAAERREPV